MKQADKYIWAIAILQFIPTMLLPPAVLGSAKFLHLILVALFVLLGWGLVKRRSWALLLSIFVQGFNVIVRVLMLLPRIMSGGKVDLAWLISSLLAIAVSIGFLLFLEKPEVQIAITA